MFNQMRPNQRITDDDCRFLCLIILTNVFEGDMDLDNVKRELSYIMGESGKVQRGRTGKKYIIDGTKKDEFTESLGDIVVSQVGELIAASLEPDELLTLLPVSKSFLATFGANSVFKPVVQRAFPNASKPRFYGMNVPQIPPDFWRKRYIDLMKDKLIEGNLVTGGH